MVEKQLLEKYFAGTCSGEEQAQVLAFLADKQADLSPLHQLMNEAAEDIGGETVPEQVETDIRSGIHKYIYLHYTIVRRMWHVAAAAAVLVPVFFAWHFFIKKAEWRGIAKGRSNGMVNDAWKTLANNGEFTRRAVLPDGTQVWLTAYSKIEYQPLLYGKQRRELKLEGEAFFEVVPDAAHAFIVQHGALATEVLGTAFNVESYADETAIRVALLSGKVRVKPQEHLYDSTTLKILKPGQVLSYHKKDGSMRIKPLLIKDEQTWKQGNIVFDDIPLKAALQRLQRRYHLSIAIPEGLHMDNMRVTAIFKGGDAQQVLQNLLFIHNLHFTINKNKVTIF